MLVNIDFFIILMVLYFYYVAVSLFPFPEHVKYLGNALVNNLLKYLCTLFFFPGGRVIGIKLPILDKQASFRKIISSWLCGCTYILSQPAQLDIAAVFADLWGSYSLVIKSILVLGLTYLSVYRIIIYQLYNFVKSFNNFSAGFICILGGWGVVHIWLALIVGKINGHNSLF